MVNYDRRVRIWDNLGIYAQISRMRALPLQTTLLKNAGALLPLQPFLNSKGPLINILVTI